jgi:hypothetical protein
MQERLIEFHPTTFEPMLSEPTLDALLHRRHQHMERLIKRRGGARRVPLIGCLARRLSTTVVTNAESWYLGSELAEGGRNHATEG